MLLRLFGGVGAAVLLHDFWEPLGDLPSPRNEMDWIVCPKRLTAPFLAGEIRLASDVTLPRGRTRLLLGSLKSKLHRLTASSSFSLRFLFKVKSQFVPGVRKVKELPRRSGGRFELLLSGVVDSELMEEFLLLDPAFRFGLSLSDSLIWIWGSAVSSIYKYTAGSI